MVFIDSGKTFDKDENYEKMKELLINKDTVQYTLRIPASMHKEVKIKLATEGKTLRGVLLEYLHQYLKES